MKDSTNTPNSGTGTDADCLTCHGDPAVCANVPGLRHCEKAMRHDAPKDARDILRDLVAACRMYDSAKPAAMQEYSFALDAAEAFLRSPISDMGRIRDAALEEAIEICHQFAHGQSDVSEDFALGIEYGAKLCVNAISDRKNAAPQAASGQSTASETGPAESAPVGTTPNRAAWISTQQYNAPLPKDGETVLIWYRQTPNGWVVYLGRYLHKLGQWRPMGGNGNFNDDITHWMPLPEAPL